MRQRAALDYPLRGPHRESALALGTALGLIVVAALRLGVFGVFLAAGPALLLAGYVSRIVERSAAGDSALPDFGSVTGLLGRGLRLGLVIFVYTAPPALYLVAVQPVLVDTATTSSGSIEAVIFVVVSTSILVVCGTFGYLLSAAVIHVVLSGSIRGMVAASRIKETATHWPFFVNWVQAAMLFVFTGSLTVALLAADTRAGLVGIPLIVYATYVGAHLIARTSGGDGS